MNSWQIIKSRLTSGSRPGTMGRTIDVQSASRLFVAIAERLTDGKESTADFNQDSEVRDSILSGPKIEELRRAGVIS
jgi:hypothetical protein